MYGLIGLVISLMMGYMNKRSGQEVPINKNGEIELRMNRLYQILGLVSIIIASVFVIAAVFYNEKEMYLIGFAMLLLFGGLGIPCLLHYQNHKLKFDNERIVVQSWTKKTEEIRWSEINDIKFKAFLGYLKIRVSNKTISIHQHFVGLKEFTNKMEDKTKWNARDLKLPIK